MKRFQAVVLVVLMSGSLLGLSACNRANNARESYIREAAPDRTSLDRQEQQSFVRQQEATTDATGRQDEGVYVRDGDEHFTGENKGVGYEEGTNTSR